MSRTALVTGASGFVGARLVDALRGVGWTVRTAGRKAADVDWTAPEAPKPSAFDGIDLLFHAAAYLPANYADPAEAAQCLQVNALGTLNLLLAAADAGVGQAVMLSSGNIYKPTESSVEDSAAYPSGRASFYLASKLCGEIWAQHLCETGRISVAVLRPSAIYGLGMKGGAVRVFVDRLQRGEAVRLDDGGRYSVDLVFVDDVVSAALSAGLKGASGAFNVGSGRATSMAELVDTLVGLTGASPALVERAPAGPGAAGGFSALNIGRARLELDYRPTPLPDGLRTML